MSGDATVPEPASGAGDGERARSAAPASAAHDNPQVVPDELRARLTELSEWRLIGRGGFASVYAARQSRLGRTVAVKLLSDRPSATALRGFLRECELLGRLSSHPGIVTVFDAGVTASERPYMVMEHLAQGSLAQRIADGGRVPMYEVVAVGRGLADALATAHRRGILHLDVKPANVFLDDDGAPVLGDFGVARLEVAGTFGTGGISFSPFYASPEVLDGERPTRATDVYGLGATLFTMIAGRPPFWDEEDNQPTAVIGRTLRARLPDLAARGAPVEIVRIVESMLHRNPEQRPTIDEVSERLGVFSSRSQRKPVANSTPSTPSSARSPSSVPETSSAVPAGRANVNAIAPDELPARRRRSVRVAVVVAGVATIIGVAAWLATRSDDRRPTLASGPAPTNDGSPSQTFTAAVDFPILPSVTWLHATDTSLRDQLVKRSGGQIADATVLDYGRGGRRRAAVVHIKFAPGARVVDEATFASEVVSPMASATSTSVASDATIYRVALPKGTRAAMFRARDGSAWLVYGVDDAVVAQAATELAQAVNR